MDVPQYDIFRGRHDEGAAWVEAVDGLDAANERMQYHALQNPDLISSTDTSTLTDGAQP
jgi:hypothetical protein